MVTTAHKRLAAALGLAVFGTVLASAVLGPSALVLIYSAMWALVGVPLALGGACLLGGPGGPHWRRWRGAVGVVLLLLAGWSHPAVQFPLREQAQKDKLECVLRFRGRPVAEMEAACGPLGGTTGHDSCYTKCPWYAPLGPACVRVVVANDEVLHAFFDDD